MSKRTDTDYLLHILGAGKRTIAYVGKTTYEEFLEDTKTQDAVLRNLEIIGEACKNISSNLKDRAPGNSMEKYDRHERQIDPSLLRRKPQYCVDSSQRGISEHHQQHQNHNI